MVAYSVGPYGTENQRIPLRREGQGSRIPQPGNQPAETPPHRHLPKGEPGYQEKAVRISSSRSHSLHGLQQRANCERCKDRYPEVWNPLLRVLVQEGWRVRREEPSIRQRVTDARLTPWMRKLPSNYQHNA